MESKVSDGRRHNFTIIDNEIIDQISSIGIYAFAVYALLTRMANSENKCFPGQQFIARSTGMSDRQVRRSIEALEKAGLITVSHRFGFQCEYRIASVKKDAPTKRTHIPRTNSPEGADYQSGESGHTVRGVRTDSPTNKIGVIRQEEQEGKLDNAATSLHHQAYIPTFSVLAAIFGTPDLAPTSQRLQRIHEASHNVNIGGIENIKKAAGYLMASDAPDSHKRFDWLLNKFDYAERITEYLTNKSARYSEPIHYDRAPADWSPR